EAQNSGRASSRCQSSGDLFFAARLPAANGNWGSVPTVFQLTRHGALRAPPAAQYVLLDKFVTARNTPYFTSTTLGTCSLFPTDLALAIDFYTENRSPLVLEL